MLLAGCKRERASASSDRVPDSFQVQLETSKGAVTVAVHRDWAPNGADRLYALLQRQFYDEARVFRVVPGFVVQFGIPGDPNKLRGMPDTPIPDDPVRQSNRRGTVSFASAGRNSRTSQLFINLADNPQLDVMGPGFPPVGSVVEGMERIDSLNAEYAATVPDQDSIRLRGNAYLARAYPRLDFIRSARIVRRWPE